MGASSEPLLDDPEAADSKLRQGITTMLAGEGGSPAPQAPGARWTTFAQYFALLGKRGLRINTVHNVGAAQVRRLVLGEEDKTPDAAQLQAMKEHVARAMRDGTAGLSTALIYPPGTYARTAEIVELAREAARYGGFYSTHMRNESGKLLEAIAESIEIGEKAGLPVHIYHLKAAGEENWPLMPKAIAIIDAARARGLDVTADIYSYIRNGLGIGSFIHPRHYAHGAAALRQSLGNPETRRALRREIENTSDWENWYRHVGGNWDNVLVAQVAGRTDKRYESKSVAEIAKMRGADVWDVFFDLAAEGGVEVNPRSMDEEQKRLALRAPFVSLCTDAPPVNPRTATGAHPRAFGSFARVLAKYVREERVIPLEDAIRKMSSLPARRLRLYDRGVIAPGMAADLVVFDPAKVEDLATFAAPLRYAEGFEYVLVNGVPVIDGGKATPAAPGRALRADGR
jgi:N-acyl-D-aspartate/D-glutamate deacylase